MKQIAILFTIIFHISSCQTTRPLGTTTLSQLNDDTLITQSLFNDRSSTISEESIQKILDGNYTLPQQLRVAIVKLESPQLKRNYWNYWNDEEYFKNTTILP